MQTDSIKPEIATYVLLNSAAADVIGGAIEDYSDEEIKKYFTGSADYFPSNYTRPEMTEKGGYNAQLMMLTLRSLESIDPVEYGDAVIFTEDFKEHFSAFWEIAKEIEGHKAYKYANSKDKNKGDFALTIPVAVAIATYAYVTEMPKSLMMSLGEHVLINMGAPSEVDIQCGRLMLYLVNNLLHEGYFGILHLQTLQDLDLCPPALAKVVDEMLEHPIDYTYLSGYISEELVSNLGYTEAVLADVFFYMLRVDTASRNQGFASPARAQWVPMLSNSSVNPADSCFSYAAICTSSEQLKAFIIKQLRESTEYSASLLALSNVFTVKCYHGKESSLDAT